MEKPSQGKMNLPGCGQRWEQTLFNWVCKQRAKKPAPTERLKQNGASVSASETLFHFRNPETFWRRATVARGLTSHKDLLFTPSQGPSKTLQQNLGQPRRQGRTGWFSATLPPRAVSFKLFL